MKEIVVALLVKELKLKKEDISNALEVPPNTELGDFAFPCFQLSKILKKAPHQIAQDLQAQFEKKLPKEIQEVRQINGYLNFFIDKTILAEQTLKRILKEKEKYGQSKVGKKKTIVVEFSSPNIAKPFGIGHLRSTIIGNAIANIAEAQGYKVIRLNYLGDWGTPFGKIIVGWEKFGDAKQLKQNPIQHLYELYVKVSSMPELEDESRKAFEKLEKGDKKSLKLWKQFREHSLKDFKKVYAILGVKFDVFSGEAQYNKEMPLVVQSLKSKKLLEKSDGAQIVNLEKYGLGVSLIEKSDGATLYATRDLAAAIDRAKKYKFANMFYEVGSEQQLHFKQIFKILELLGYSWASECKHVSHGLYLDSDGKKFSTRKGKTVFMQEILDETQQLAKAALQLRSELPEKEINKRALTIARAAILYGDLKNFRQNDLIFDIERFVSFEGDTGPYLQYAYARARSILRKVRKKQSTLNIEELHEKEIALIKQLDLFPQTLEHAYVQTNPAIIAHYSFELAQTFNEFYHACPVIGNKHETFRLQLIQAFCITLKNALALLGIDVLEEM